MAVGGQLDAARQPSSQVVHEMIRRARVPAAHEPARDKFRVRAERNPRPHAAHASGVLHVGRHVFVLRIDEAPDFIALNPFALEVAERLVLIRGTGRAKLHQELLNRRAVNACHANCGAERISLDQAGHHFHPFVCRQFIHGREYA